MPLHLMREQRCVLLQGLKLKVHRPRARSRLIPQTHPMPLPMYLQVILPQILVLCRSWRLSTSLLPLSPRQRPVQCKRFPPLRIHLHALSMPRYLSVSLIAFCCVPKRTFNLRLRDRVWPGQSRPDLARLSSVRMTRCVAYSVLQ